MSSSEDLRVVFEELEQLRESVFQASSSETDNFAVPVAEIAQKQLQLLETVNNFFKTFVSETALTSRMESTSDCLVMPSMDSVLNFKQLSEGALEIHHEIAKQEKSDGTPEKISIESHKKMINELTICDANNRDFNKCYKGALKHFSPQVEVEEFNDSTINTIVSDDVLASSPI